MLQQLALATIIFQAVIISRTAGHGNIIVPKPEGNAEHPYYIGGPAGTIDKPEIIGSASYGDYYQAVDDWFTKNNVASLKEFITTYGTDISECGNTEKKGTAQPVPSDGYAQHDTLGNSHPGPCEIWCDDTRVFHDTNCVATFSGQSPAKIPIDVSTCKSSSEFVFYWLALHAQPWQVYINCVALDGTSAASTGSSSNSTSASTTTATTTAPTTTTTPELDEASEGGEASAEEETTEAPSPRVHPKRKLLPLKLRPRRRLHPSAFAAARED
ncbi:Beta-glucan synthesis-associated protein SKN1 [Phytophthora nicotianae]|uniref:Beta-glucan synthesis-associated protein SKN1 n=1 Tax=Phytophthora nicotianae TaxID=4792 RepID=A0A0W8CRA0_PHYNI|nr:Beta-glucan synthesis-associated protein SKN1 [Phytophthora nicotianae]